MFGITTSYVNQTVQTINYMKYNNTMLFTNIDLFSSCMYASTIASFHIFYIILFGFLFRKTE